VSNLQTIFSWLALLLGLLFLAPAHGQAQLQPVDAAAVDSVLQEALQSWHVPGAAVVIVVGDRIVYLKGLGLREASSKATMTGDTIVLLGSCSKPFTSLLLAMLAAEGKLDWDDPLHRHLPWFHLTDPLADANVTLRDLLCHRTGVASHDMLWYRAPWSQKEMIQKTCKLRPEQSFRTALHYQSILYGAAGQAGAAAAGDSWANLMHKRVLGPLGMTRTTVTTAENSRLSDRATPHRRTAAGKVVPLPWYEFPEGNPAGSVCSCARDLGNFLRLQLNEGMLQGKRLVAADSLLETRTPQIVIPIRETVREMNPFTTQMSYGMGWVVQDYRGHLMHVHGGAIDGFRTQLTLLPQSRLGIAILSNLAETQMNLAVTNTLVDQILGLPYKDWNGLYGRITQAAAAAKKKHNAERLAKRHQGTKPSRELTAYVGTYEDPAYGAAQVTLEGGKLIWTWSSFRCPLEHFHFDTFSAPHEYLEDVQVVFGLDAAGDVTRLAALDRVFRKVAK